ncbi:6623_t:CDS:2, partial [Gigaspora margarita]
MKIPAHNQLTVAVSLVYILTAKFSKNFLTSPVKMPSVNNDVVVKVGMVGDPKINKTSLMQRFVESDFDAYYNQTNAIHFKEKIIELQKYYFRFSIWDYGQPEFIHYVCYDSVAILFIFDLLQISTLNSIKKWYKQTRSLNK